MAMGRDWVENLGSYFGVDILTAPPSTRQQFQPTNFEEITTAGDELKGASDKLNTAAEALTTAAGKPVTVHISYTGGSSNYNTGRDNQNSNEVFAVVNGDD
jgi:hypothetical protein